MKAGDVLAGKYRLEQKIGEGAMGAVWAAQNTATLGKIAIKLIVPQAQELRTKDLRVRLLREAKNCGKLRHRNIVQIHDVGETPEGDPFLVMELLRGQTLGDLLKEKRRLEPALAARIGAEIASALAVAHAAQVIHRDLKPANIFLHHEDGMPEGSFVSKILDFGVAKNLDGNDVAATQTGVAVGSVAYMSPEQVAVRKDLDGTSDIWAVGIVLFELLTGARPFSGSIMDVSRMILMTSINPVPAPSTRVRGVPPELDAIVKRCTEPTRTNRYKDAGELARALAAVAETSLSSQFPVSVPAPSASSPQRAPTYNPMDVAAAPPLPQPLPSHAAMPSFHETPLVDLEGTVPMSPAMMAAARAARVGPPGSSKEQAVTGTQIIDPSQPVASPNPEWRKEYEAERARRQSSAFLPAVELPPVDSTGTTSAAGALTQPSARIPVPQALRQEVAVESKKSNGNRKLVLTIVGLASLSALMAGLAFVVVRNGGEPAKENEKATAPEAASAAPKAAAPAVLQDNLPRPPVTAEVKAPEPVAPEPAKTEAPPPPPPPPPPVQTTKAPILKNTSVVKPKGPVCTGVGLFKKCK